MKCSRDFRNNFRNERGTTIVELAVASIIALIFIFAAGTAYIVNQKTYSRNDEKRKLQQTASYVMEIMERKIRSGARAAIANPQRIQVFDKNGNEITRFRLQVTGTTARLFEQNSLIAQQDLIQLSFVPNSDTTEVTIFLEMQDSGKNKVAVKASAALRNHKLLRNVK